MRFGTLIELLVIRGLSEVGFGVSGYRWRSCVVFSSVGVGHGFREKGDIVNESVSISYHGPNNYIGRAGFVDSKGRLPTLPSPHGTIGLRYLT